MIQRSLPLQRVPAMPDEPAGYSFEVVDDSLRAEGWAAAYRRAFAPEMMDLETRRNVSRCPSIARSWIS
ncbi:MAG: hypothetical protein R2849_14770 [Thermomicrobiales bacterium]